MSEPMNERYDILIAGGGITGLTLACALKDAGLKIGVIERQPPHPHEAEYALRVSAINRASLLTFSAVGAFERMVSVRVSPFRDMHVWDVTGAGQIHFDSAELGLDALGYIIENRVVQHGLLEVLQQSENLHWLCPVEIASIELVDGCGYIILADGAVLSADLVVGADGAASAVRTAAGIELTRSSYQQQAIVCTVGTELGHAETAWQCFSPSGPLAFLPLADGRCSIVWSLDEDRIDAMLALEDADFTSALEQAFEYRLGAVTSVSTRAVFPLGHGHVDSYIRPGVALIGDAAHQIHPLAGQGANLGIMDAACLAQVIVQAKAAHRDWSALHTLRKYERWRKGDNRLMENAMTAFKILFGNNDPLLGTLRNTGLGIADQLGPLKYAFMQHAMGVSGDLPEIAKTVGL
jgi:2-octaprenylphenol hydroxylase